MLPTLETIANKTPLDSNTQMGKKSRKPAPAPRSSGPAGPASFSYVPYLLRVVHQLVMKGQVPQEAMFYAVHRIMALEGQYGSQRGFHALVHGSGGSDQTTEFVHHVLQHMAQDHQRAQARQQDSAAGGGESPGDDRQEGPTQEDSVEEAQDQDQPADGEAGRGEEEGEETAVGSTADKLSEAGKESVAEPQAAE